MCLYYAVFKQYNARIVLFAKSAFSESNECSAWGLKSRARTAAGESPKYPQEQKAQGGSMWLRTRNDKLINLDHVREVAATDRYLTVTYGSDGKREVVNTYEEEESASRALGDLVELISESQSIPFADNNVVFEI